MNEFITAVRAELKTADQLKEVEKFKITFDLGMRANPIGTTELLVRLLEPFADEILRGDEDFFLTAEIDQADQQNASLLKKLKKWWPALSPDFREEVKNTLKLLLMLGTLATKNERVLTVINQYRDEDNPLTFDV